MTVFLFYATFPPSEEMHYWNSVRLLSWMSRTYPRVFPKQHPMSVMCPQQAGFVQLQYTDSTYCSRKEDTRTLPHCSCLLSTDFRLLILMWYLHYLIKIHCGVISPVLIKAEAKIVLARTCFVGPVSLDSLKTKSGIVDDVWHKPRASLANTALQTCGKCHLDGNQMRIKSGPTLVCFQEVSQLATEEVSIFRQMGPAVRLSSLVDRQLDSGSEVCVFLCTRGTDYTCMFGRLCLFLYVCVLASLLRMVLLRMPFFSLESCAFYVFVESDARAPKCNNS